MITATLCGDPITKLNGEIYIWPTIQQAFLDLSESYSESFDAIEIYDNDEIVTKNF